MSPTLFSTLKSLGIISPVVQTKRGKRAGRAKLRRSPDGRNPRNLIKISCHPWRTQHQQNLRFCTVNIRSIRNKYVGFLDYILSNKVDVCAITETWLTKDDDAIRAACQPEGYTFLDHNRSSGRRGGGTAVLISSSLSTKKLAAGECDPFAFSDWLLTKDNFRLRLAIIYRPPYSDQHPVPVSIFWKNFQSIWRSLSHVKSNF